VADLFFCSNLAGLVCEGVCLHTGPSLLVERFSMCVFELSNVYLGNRFVYVN
jgi:hypothetical protein